MQYKYLGHKKYFLRFQPNEDFLEELTNFFEICDLKSAIIINGIGKTNSAKLGYFDEKIHKYLHKEIKSSCEIINISGSINYDEHSNIRVHAHTCLSDENFQIFGGHVLNLEIGITLEMFIQEIGYELVAYKNQDLNLQLLEVLNEK